VQSYIRKAIEEGADVLVGGEGHPKGLEAGHFVKPTVFVNVMNDMTVAREEIFSPVLSVIDYEDEEDAIRIANDTDFGLHAYVSGTDVKRARRVASKLLAGRVAINGLLDDQQAPFGGFKHSGIGREFGCSGSRRFLNREPSLRQPERIDISEHDTISQQEAADRLAIRELIEAYAQCADRRDAKGQMSLFTENTHFVVFMNAKDPKPSQELHSREALAPVFADLNKYDATTHFVGQSTIFTLTADRANGEAYCLAHHVKVAGGKRRLRSPRSVTLTRSSR
jgi:delta 1-pyrroline-5-carboxylate dehydrogenase